MQSVTLRDWLDWSQPSAVATLPAPLLSKRRILGLPTIVKLRCSRPATAPRYRWLSLLLLATLVVTQAGCVQRRFTIRSNPPGALVYIDDYEVGTTPVSTDFVYYGTRKVRLVKDGYETLTVLQPVPSPWYEVPPLDFVSENLVPSDIRDERLLCYNLTPQVVVPLDQLKGRAEGVRRSSQASAAENVVPVQAIEAIPQGMPAIPQPGRPTVTMPAVPPGPSPMLSPQGYQ